MTKKNYESLLSRRESAQISGDMEANASAMDFRVIDPPQVPSVSNWPNRPLLMSGVLLGALGAGLALAFLMSQLRPTMNDERRLREISGLPVLGTVVMGWTEAQRKQRKKGLDRVCDFVRQPGFHLCRGNGGSYARRRRGPDMSIIERAADLLRPASKPQGEPVVGVVGEVKTPEPDLIERAVGNDGLHSRSFAAANRVRAADVEPSRAPDSRQVSRLLHIDIAKLREQSVISPDGERSPNAESFRRIKRKILFDAVNPKSETATNLVMVTSALPGEGKTFCTINLAISIAMEINRTILLVDADVAKPSITSMLGIRSEGERGLMDVLYDKRIDLADVLCKTDIANLNILPAGTKHARGTEMLAGNRMGALLAEMAERYHDRIILFDSPPLLAASEASVLAERMGQILMVVEAGRTTERALKDALARVESCNVVGLLLNKGTAAGSGYGAYGYGYGYGYGA